MDVDHCPARSRKAACGETEVFGSSYDALAMIVEYSSEGQGAQPASVEADGSSNAQKPETEEQQGADGAEDGMCIILACHALVFMYSDFAIFQKGLEPVLGLSEDLMLCA